MMRTKTLTLAHQIPLHVRWVVAGLAALVAALSITTRAHAATLTPTCAYDSGTNTRTCHLWAKSGTLTLPDSTSVTIWGYALNSADPAQLPGPTLVAIQGESLVVVVHNQLGEASSLALHGQGLPTDMVGAAAGGNATYTVPSVRAGTFLYEAGLTENGAKQVAMGLYGALIVKSSTADLNEEVLVLSEIDPALNINPAGFNMLDYAPKYWLINGQAYPDTASLVLPSGDSLLRYVNAGLTEHSMTLLGLPQTVLAKDGYSRAPFQVVAETVAAGQTMDVRLTLPNTSGTRYTLYDANRHLDNNGDSFGGMMMLVTVNAAPVAEAGENQTITMPDSVTLDGTVTDDGLPNPPATVATTWSLVSGPGTVSFGDANAVDTTASFSVAGEYVLRLTANDGQVTASDDITITVNPELVNLAPVVEAGGNQTVTLPDSAMLDGAVTDDGLPDPPATVITAWSVVSGPGTVTFDDANVADTSASFSVAGEYVLRLTADDGELTTSADVTITVNPAPVNAAPSVDAGAAQTITLPDSATLDGAVTDDGLPNPPATVTTTWSLVSGPDTVVFGDANAVDTTVTFSVGGEYVLRLTADDGDLTASADVTITVNLAPSVDAGSDQTITLPTDSANLDGTVSDDGLPNPPATLTTTWSVISGPGTVTFGDLNVVDTTATFSTAGTYVLRLTADDGTGEVYDEITVTVNPA